METHPAHLLLRGGTVIDGTGALRYRADVRVEDERISEIGADLTARGAFEIDAAAQVVCPGFIDVHTHDDQMLLSLPQMLPKISQGVTTVITGNCGISLAPLVHPDVPPPLNLLGGADKYIFPTMRAYAEAVGVYATHIRNEFEKVIEALEEAFESARQAGIPVVISHHKCAGPANWGRTLQTLAYIDTARKQHPIGLDVYPYIAGSTILRADMVDGVIEILVTWSQTHPQMAGRLLADIAQEWGCTQPEACERLQPGGA